MTEWVHKRGGERGRRKKKDPFPSFLPLSSIQEVWWDGQKRGRKRRRGESEKVREREKRERKKPITQKPTLNENGGGFWPRRKNGYGVPLPLPPLSLSFLSPPKKIIIGNFCLETNWQVFFIATVSSDIIFFLASCHKSASSIHFSLRIRLTASSSTALLPP